MLDGAALDGKTICFSGNARSGEGGQGEFLRQMVFALDHMPARGRVVSRGAGAERAVCWDIPWEGLERSLSSVVARVPIARRRRDLLTLWNDEQFDRGAARRLAGVASEIDLLDGVMGQCDETFAALRRGKTRLVLTSLNTHVDHMAAVLEDEHRRVGFSGPTFVHARMKERARREISAAARIRVNSERARSTFVERGVPAERIDVIYPGVDHARFHPTEKRDDVFRVLAVSTVEPRKGLHYLLQAFEEARIERSELVVIGATADRWSRRMLDGFRARNANVRTLSLDVTKAPVEESYGAASVLCHPAIEDGFGLVVLQALASGRPVVATRETGAAELIEEGKTGFVVAARSVEALRDRLRLLAADPALRAAMGEAAPGSVRRLDVESFAREVGALYGRVLAT